MNGDFDKPMLFTAETPQRKFVAYIDPENKFCIEDKLSQVRHFVVKLIFSNYIFIQSQSYKKCFLFGVYDYGSEMIVFFFLIFRSSTLALNA